MTLFWRQSAVAQRTALMRKKYAKKRSNASGLATRGPLRPATWHGRRADAGTAKCWHGASSVWRVQAKKWQLRRGGAGSRTDPGEKALGVLDQLAGLGS